MALIPALFGLFAAPAEACSLMPPATLVLASVEDPDAPLPPAIVGVEVQRGHPSGNSCADLGFITITVARPDDDADTDDDVGYRFELLSGELPEGLHLPTASDAPMLGPELFLHWNDGSSSVQDAFDAVVGLRSVDVAGNLSDEVEVTIADGGGCSCAHEGSTWAVGPLGILAAWLLRRKRA